MSLVNSELLHILTNVASAYFRNWYCFVPSGMSLRGLNVRVLPLFVVRIIETCENGDMSTPLTSQRTKT